MLGILLILAGFVLGCTIISIFIYIVVKIWGRVEDDILDKIERKVRRQIITMYDIRRYLERYYDISVKYNEHLYGKPTLDVYLIDPDNERRTELLYKMDYDIIKEAAEGSEKQENERFLHTVR